MANIDDKKDAVRIGGGSSLSDQHEQTIERGDLINASGHVQELDRNFGLLQATGLGITVGNVCGYHPRRRDSIVFSPIPAQTYLGTDPLSAPYDIIVTPFSH